ncbi:MAG: DUF488 domain-containing protein [Thermoleophilia bacterium]
MTTIFTIGHSNLSIETFFALLEQHRIALLVDVRTSPYSRYAPQFNREPLAAETTRRGLVYRYLGEDLGGRPSDPVLLTDGASDYDKMAVDIRLLDALGKVVATATTRRMALLCSEGDPAECHRGRLLGRVLVNRFSVDVAHITADGLRSQLDLLPQQTTCF